MQRREFVAGLGGAAALLMASPKGAQTQQSAPIRRIGVLASLLAADNPDWQARDTAFVQGLQQLGWTAGRNVDIDYRSRRCRWSDFSTTDQPMWVRLV